MDMLGLTTPTAGKSLRDLEKERAALTSLGRLLKGAGYQFVSPTPLTYGRVLKRPRPAVSDPLVEAFGWNRPFQGEQLNQSYRALLSDGGLVETTGQGEQRSLVRFSTLGELLFAHSGFPTNEPDSVFFGPDTYRFSRAIRTLVDHATDFSPRTIIDIGAGTGVGGIYAASLFPGRARTILADINPRALAFAEVNACLNDIAVDPRQSDILANVDGDGDLIISNPPYLVDARQRAYRHGGGNWGCTLAVRILEESLGRLTAGGRLLLYTGAPIVCGVDMFLEAAKTVLTARVRDFRYEEQDPDVFGEELESAPYDRADRIATVVLNVKATDIIR